MSAVLEVEGLRTEFHLRRSNVVAVDNVSFHVDEGECVGVVGESGCGKSTTGLSIMKLLPNVGHIDRRPDQSQRPRPSPSARRRCARSGATRWRMIFQDPMTSLNPTMTIGRQIAEGVRLHRDVSKAEARDAGARGPHPGRHAPARGAAERTIPTSCPAGCASG